MLIREYNDGDLDALRAIHAAQGFPYAFPDLNNPLFVTKLVLSDASVAQAFRPEVSESADSIQSGEKEASPQQGKGLTPEGVSYMEHVNSTPRDASENKIHGAAFLRLTAEAYLLLDPRIGTPRERWQWLLALHAAAERDAWHRGLEDVHAWLPPPIAQKFGHRLARLCWRRDDTWTPYCKRLDIPNCQLPEEHP